MLTLSPVQAGPASEHFWQMLRKKIGRISGIGGFQHSSTATAHVNYLQLKVIKLTILLSCHQLSDLTPLSTLDDSGASKPVAVDEVL